MLSLQNKEKGERSSVSESKWPNMVNEYTQASKYVVLIYERDEVYIRKSELVSLLGSNVRKVDSIDQW